MIRMVLLGRTGNHLFQYALGRVLAEKHAVPLVLDASWFNAEGWSEVSHFLKLPLKARVVRRFSLASRALRNLTGKHYWELTGKPVLREQPDDQSFDPRFLDAPPDCVLFGYFQTPRYFESIELQVRQELASLAERAAIASVASSSSGSSGGSKPHLSQPQSVAVHVRRGDYLHHPALRVCDESYYRRAMDQMRALVPGARFYVFSDDPAWCKQVFTTTDTEVIDSGRHAANPLHDLHLMTLASHHIIANSTYSWWAAWIASKPGQIVLMPDRWYAEGTFHAPIAEKRGGTHWISIVK